MNHKVSLLCCSLMLLALVFVFPAHAQVDYLTLDIDGMFGLWYSDSDWGDCDNDGDLDLLMVGYGLTTGQGYSKYYRNDGESDFTLLPTDVVGTGNGSIHWGDLDGDNDLDAIVCGQVATGVDTTRIYINNGGVLTDSNVQLPPRVSSSLSLGDFDIDGDLDILITGGDLDNASVGYIHILRNDGGFAFTPVEVMNPGIRNGMAEFGDYNGDGWLDIALTGSAGSSNYISKILRGSANGSFTDIAADIYGLRYSRIAWVDFDCDGDLDVALSGSYSNEQSSLFRLYRNDGADTFTEVPQSVVLGERQGDMVWGDLNHDGYPDLILNGLITTTTTVANIYLYNPQTALYEDAQTMIYLKYAAMTLGDYNNDNKLDMSLSGHYEYQVYWNQLYLNTAPQSNTPPQAPSGLSDAVVGSDVVLAWDAGIDGQTPATGLTYNVRLGTTPGGNEIISSMSTAAGWRKISRPGNAWQRSYYQVLGLPDGVYYWSVQSIDNSFCGSPFAAERSFTVGDVAEQDELVPVLASVSSQPNPFAGQTAIRVELKSPASLKASVYNHRGQLVKVLADGQPSSGTVSLAWDGTDANGHVLPAGIYILRVSANGQNYNRKLVKIK